MFKGGQPVKPATESLVAQGSLRFTGSKGWPGVAWSQRRAIGKQNLENPVTEICQSTVWTGQRGERRDSAVAGCTRAGGQANGGGGMWDALWHVPPTDPSVADHVRPITATVFPDRGGGLFRHYHATQNCSGLVWGTWECEVLDSASTLPQISIQCGRCCKI